MGAPPAALTPTISAVAAAPPKSGFQCDDASFFGSSYIKVPLQDAKNTTNLSLSFRTARADTLLLLAAGRTDYCYLRLEGGRLKVRINLGAGEWEMDLPRALRLNDLAWHNVTLSRREAEINVTIDRIHETSEKLSGGFFELNIHFGVYLGGLGDFTDLFLGHTEWLRGCLAEVYYNGANLLQRARQRSVQKVEVQDITWKCSPEFDATTDQEISFVEDDAFIAMPNTITRTGARWEFSLKTEATQGLLLYNSGTGSRADLVALEIDGGRVRLLLDKGDGHVEILSDVRIDDGRWHTVVAHFNPSMMEVSVDGRVTTRRLERSGSQYLDLQDVVYLGGTELNKKAHALRQGLKSADISFRGCLRSVTVDGRRVGLPDARVSHGVRPDCVWDFVCSRDPCVPGARCRQQGLSSFRCQCDQDMCVKADYADTYKVFSRGSQTLDVELVELNAIQVTEGESGLVTTDNIRIVLDYAKFGVRDAGVLLHAIEAPAHGRLEVAVWQRGGVPNHVQSRLGGSAGTWFTFLDVVKEKVRYHHDGSESTRDAVLLEVEFATGPDFVQSLYLQGPHRFALPVNVTPANDAPSLSIPPGKKLRLAQGTRKTLGPELLQAQDPDSPTASLVYRVLEADAAGVHGRVESAASPGTAITTFSQDDVDNGRIVYAHRGQPNDKIALQVSDGIETSSTVYIPVSAFPIVLRLVNNTGLVMTYRSWVFLLPDNLTFLSNGDDPDLEIHYEITKQPQYGALQRLSAVGDTTSLNNAKWQTIDRFTSRQLAHEQIRYIHEKGSPSHDEFKFKVSAGDARSPTVYDFRITFAKLRLESHQRQDVTLRNVREALITDRHLLYRTEPMPTEVSRVVYHVVQPPHYGWLVLGQQHRLVAGDFFSQQDLREGRLVYKLHRKAYSRIHDEFTFRASAPECEAIPGSLTLVHEVAGGGGAGVRATIERLQVVEGGSASITSNALRLDAPGVTALNYSVTGPPQHGWLSIGPPLGNQGGSASGGLLVKTNTTEFSSKELSSGHIVYNHDDSESRKDSFNFVALSSEAEDFMYAGTFHVDVLLKNDNAPVRTVDRVFHVVSGGERLLTGRHLHYEDADADTSPADVLYKRQDVANGGLYLAAQPNAPVMEFTQADLNAGRLLFRHQGVESGQMPLWVTDGQFYANGVLDIRASPPYVELTNNSRLVVRHGGAASFTTVNLCADSNVNSLPEQLTFQVLEGPNHGRLFLREAPAALSPSSATPTAAADRPTDTFTQLDLEQSRLWYQHDASASASDTFRFRVDVPGTTAEGRFDVRVFPVSYWEPFVVATNKTLHVEEATSVVVSNEFLHIKQPHVPASDITFVVAEPPRYGYLEIEPLPADSGKERERDRDKSVNIFEQALVNEGRLLYVQVAANQTEDRVVIDVTNGITWLRGLIIRFVVVPDRLYIGGSEVRVAEGAAVTVPATALTVLTEYYRGRVSEFRVVNPPSAGRLQHAREPGQRVDRFSAQQLQAGLLQYVHDGTETLEDSFTVTAKADDKESVPTRVRVTVVPVNDEPPKITNSTGLTLWQGSSATITSSNLAVIDADTAPQNLTFRVIGVGAGHVALASDPSTPLKHFTQFQIDAGLIIFVHSGGADAGSLEVSASDGARDSSPVRLEIRARRAVLRPEIKEALHVFPMLQKCLTPSHLLYTCGDPTRNVSYSIRSTPTLGNLLFKKTPDSVQQGIFNFTQRDINDSKICYQHMSPLKDVSANDSFTVDVTAPFSEPLRDQVFQIEISVWSGGLDQFVPSTRLLVDEGNSTPLLLNTSTLTDFLKRKVGLVQPVIQVTVSQPPLHGKLCLAAECNSVDTFFAEELAAGKVVYQHDHSDTTWDEVSLSLLLSPGDVLLCNVSVPITVLPVNDQPFRLAVPAPQLVVVQGQAAVVSRRQLLTEDADTRADELIYEVISGPSQGRLMLVHNSSSPAATSTISSLSSAENSGSSPSIGRFSQADIDAGRLLYVHAGLPLQPDSFYFRVSDGKFNPVYTVFNIQVEALTLEVEVVNPIRVQQGSSVGPLSAELFKVITNGKREGVQYNVTRPPLHGAIYNKEKIVVRFSQADVEGGKVLYMQSDMIFSSDSLELSAWLPLGQNGPPLASPDHVVNVTVVPLVRIGAFSPIVGGKTRLDLSALDASQLASMTGGNPSYRLIRKSRLGRIRKIVRSSGERSNGTNAVRERDTETFTHEELRSGLIYYVAKRAHGGQPGDNDSFAFELSSSILQPSIGELRFFLRSENGPIPTVFVPQRPRVPNPKFSHGNDNDAVIVASPNMSTDYFLIVSVIAGVVVLGLLVIVIVKCRAGAVPGSLDGHPMKGDLGDRAPLPLPPLPDDLLPSSPRPKHFGVPPLSLASTPTPTPTPGGPLPQCKVVPLLGDSMTSSEVDLGLNLRYPYGVADDPPTSHDSWAGYDAAATSRGSHPDLGYAPRTANPMLRRNQYWV